MASPRWRQFRRRRTGRAPPASAKLELEPFRILYNSLSLLPHTHPIKTVIVTSAVPIEGKTSVALGLARAAAHSGRQVIIVDADLRRPTLERRLELPSSPRGLASALRGEADPLELLQTPDSELDRDLKLLPSGPIPLNVTTLLNPVALAEIFTTLAAQVDLVVIDSAPLLPVADTRELLDAVAVDACLIVARAGVTTRDQVRRARLVFERRKLQAVGLVVNALTDVTNKYGYYDGEGSDASERPAAVAARGSLRNTERTSATVSTRSTSRHGT